MLDGVLFFPVTPFAADGAVDAGALAEHVRREWRDREEQHPIQHGAHSSKLVYIGLACSAATIPAPPRIVTIGACPTLTRPPRPLTAALPGR